MHFSAHIESADSVRSLLSEMEPVGGKELVMAITSIIEGIASVGDSQSPLLPPTVFSCSCVPRIRLCDYIER